MPGHYVHDRQNVQPARESTGLALSQSQVVKALVRQQYDIYPVGQNEFIQNIFALNLDLATTPLLGSRLLQLLSDVPPDERRNTLLAVDQIEAYMAAMGIENRAVRLWLDALLKTGLILDYDATTVDVGSAKQVELSPSGRRHLSWALGEPQYVAAMGDITPLLQEAVFDQLETDIRGNVNWRRQMVTFVKYLLSEDSMYCQGSIACGLSEPGSFD